MLQPKETRERTMKKSKKILKMSVLAMMIALGVVISPILRVEGMCPMAHFINVVCSVLLGPWYSLACAVLIGIIRMMTMAIPPLALTGAVFGAFLSGVFYRASKGNLLMAVFGEIIGTGIIGAVMSYPVMTIFWGKEGLSWFFYVPSFICGTLIGGSIAFAFLKKLAKSGLLQKMQSELASEVYESKIGVLENSISIAALGVIGYVVIGISSGLFKWQSAIWTYASRTVLVVFIVIACIYYAVQHIKRGKNENAERDA